MLSTQLAVINIFVFSHFCECCYIINSFKKNIHINVGAAVIRQLKQQQQKKCFLTILKGRSPSIKYCQTRFLLTLAPWFVDNQPFCVFTWSYLCACLCPNPIGSQRYQSYWIRVHLNDPNFNSIIFLKTPSLNSVSSTGGQDLSI